MILGKYQGTKRVNHPLHARVALAAALWHGAGDPEMPIFFAAADTHGAARTPDAEVVRALLVERWGVPARVVHVRRWSRCTVVEARAARVLLRAHALAGVDVVTHGYHRRRARAYLAEVGLRARVLAADRATLATLAPPAALGRALEAAVAAGEPRRLDLLRERAVEAALTLLHRLDARGRLERVLAVRLRRRNGPPPRAPA